MRAFTVDLGGTKIKLAVIDNGQVVAYSTLAVNHQDNMQVHMSRVADELSALAKLSASCSITKIGVAFAGIVNPIEKRVVTSNGKYPDAAVFDFAKWGREQFGAELYLENDANAALVGELAFGSGQKCRNAVMMILGTGVGTAAVMGGRLVRGKHFQAGCLGGHLPLQMGSRICTCGNTGCVEANASTWALPIIAKEYADYSASKLSNEEKLNFESLEKWYLNGDALAINLVNQFVDCWSTGIVGLVHAYDPEMVILSGGVMKFNSLFEMLCKRTNGRTWTPWGNVRLVRANNPEQSVLLGLYNICTKKSIFTPLFVKISSRRKFINAE